MIVITIWRNEYEMWWWCDEVMRIGIELNGMEWGPAKMEEEEVEEADE